MDGVLDYELAKENRDAARAALAEVQGKIESMAFQIDDYARDFGRKMAVAYLSGDEKAMKRLVEGGSSLSNEKNKLIAVLDGLSEIEAEASRIVGAHESHEARVAEFEEAKTALVALAARKAEFDTRMEMAVSNTERRHLVEEYRDVRLIPKRTFLTRRMAAGLGCTEDFDLWLAQLGLEVVARNPVSGVRVGYVH